MDRTPRQMNKNRRLRQMNKNPFLFMVASLVATLLVVGLMTVRDLQSAAVFLVAAGLTWLLAVKLNQHRG
jgi:hypothetical protein